MNTEPVQVPKHKTLVQKKGIARVVVQDTAHALKILLTSLPFWIINVLWICSIVGLIITGIAADCGAAHVLPGSYLKSWIIKYLNSIKERANEPVE